LRPQLINRLSLVLLLLGLGAAVVMFFTAAPPDRDAWRDDPLGNRRYRRELRVLGGQANQLSADFIEWFSGLWEGRPLAYTTAVLTLAATGTFRFVAARMTPRGCDDGSAARHAVGR